MNIKMLTNLSEEEINFEESINEIWKQLSSNTLKSGTPNIKERSKKKGTKYISEEMEKFKNKK